MEWRWAVVCEGLGPSLTGNAENLANQWRGGGPGVIRDMPEALSDIRRPQAYATLRVVKAWLIMKFIHRP